jgi:hypothetical protein
MNEHGGCCSINYDFLVLLPFHSALNKAVRQVNSLTAVLKLNINAPDAYTLQQQWCLANSYKNSRTLSMCFEVRV